MEELTDALLEAGRDLFYMGLTDFHSGGDWAAAMRGPERLALDLVEPPHQVRRLLAVIEDAYPRIYDHFHRRPTARGQPVTSWPGIVSVRKWYVVSNDFSCMISREMFEEFFLPGIVEECRFLEASLYHLDGPGALHHLDRLLETPELDAVQWVCGAGNGRASDWLDVYRRCQAAGKALQIHIQPDEIETIVENLRPEGVWLQITDVRNRREAQALIERVTPWA